MAKWSIDTQAGILIHFYGSHLYARVVELADTLDLGSSAVRFKGSSPFSRSIRQVPSLVKPTCIQNMEYNKHGLTRIFHT